MDAVHGHEHAAARRSVEVRGKQAAFWDWLEPLQQNGTVKAVYVKTGRGLFMVLDVDSHETLHRYMTESADRVPAAMQVWPLVETGHQEAIARTGAQKRSDAARRLVDAGPVGGIRHPAGIGVQHGLIRRLVGEIREGACAAPTRCSGPPTSSSRAASGAGSRPVALLRWAQRAVGGQGPRSTGPAWTQRNIGLPLTRVLIYRCGGRDDRDSNGEASEQALRAIKPPADAAQSDAR